MTKRTTIEHPQLTLEQLKLRLKLAFIMELDNQVQHYLKECEKIDPTPDSV